MEQLIGLRSRKEYERAVYSHLENIMRNAGLDELQVGIKKSGRNINNLRYADDTTLKAESKEELKSLLKMVKEESERVSLKLYILYVTLYTNILSFLTAMIDYRNT